MVNIIINIFKYESMWMILLTAAQLKNLFTDFNIR